MKEIRLVANFKMNKDEKEIRDWFNQFTLPTLDHPLPLTIDICLPLPYPILFKPSPTASIGYGHLSTSGNITVQIGAQNVASFADGAYTGEVSAQMLQDIGVKTVIIGHSERRLNFAENSHQIVNKALLLLESNLTPILCISQIKELVEFQELFLKQKKAGLFSLLIVAYEPLAAIGSGKPDNPQNANQMALAIKQTLKINVRVLYGGSVDSQNIMYFLREKELDGFLVGTASLDSIEFTRLVHNTVRFLKEQQQKT